MVEDITLTYGRGFLGVHTLRLLGFVDPHFFVRIHSKYGQNKRHMPTYIQIHAPTYIIWLFRLDIRVGFRDRFIGT